MSANQSARNAGGTKKLRVERDTAMSELTQQVTAESELHEMLEENQRLRDELEKRLRDGP